MELRTGRKFPSFKVFATMKLFLLLAIRLKLKRSSPFKDGSFFDHFFSTSLRYEKGNELSIPSERNFTSSILTFSLLRVLKVYNMKWTGARYTIYVAMVGQQVIPLTIYFYSLLDLWFVKFITLISRWYKMLFLPVSTLNINFHEKVLGSKMIFLKQEIKNYEKFGKIIWIHTFSSFPKSFSCWPKSSWCS